MRMLIAETGHVDRPTPQTRYQGLRLFLLNIRLRINLNNQIIPEPNSQKASPSSLPITT